MTSVSGIARVLSLMLLFGCSIEPPEADGDDEADADADADADSDADADADAGTDWEYRTFCWLDSDNDCRFSDGTPAGQERVNCIGVGDPYVCVTDALNSLGEEGWRIELVESTFPVDGVVHLLYRPL